MAWNVPTRLFDFVTQGLNLEAHERRLLLWMGILVGTLFCAYTIAKVLRDSLFLSEFGALALPYGYIAVALAAVGFVWLESRVALRFKLVGATRFNQYAAIGFSILAALVFPIARHWTVAVFYVWAGSQAMMLLPHFWALAIDVWDSRRARSVFPLLGGCGLVGGLAGGAFAAWATPIVKRDGLMWTLSGLLIVGHLITRLIERHRARRPGPVDVSHTVSHWAIIRRSNYIKILAAGLALSVIVSTLVDFQFKIFIQKIYPDPHALTQFFGKFYLGLNALALVFQIMAGSWLMVRLGLGITTGLQPATALLFVSGLFLGAGWWIVLGVRWIQGVVFQTLGKSSAEIYFMAIRPHERRRIKPAVDTLVDRWADAAVGVLLIVLLRVLGVGATVLAVLTILFVAIWIVVLVLLNREYGRAFEETLSTHWLEPEAGEETIRTPSARKALLEGLRADDEPRIVLALKLRERSGDHRSGARCRLPPASLARRERRPVERWERCDCTTRRSDQGFVEPHEGLRRAAIRYLLLRGERPALLARAWLDGDDPTLRMETVDALFDLPSEGRAALTLEWIDARIESGTREDLLVAGRALGALSGSAPVRRLRTLLANPDVEVRRVALLSAARRPSPELLDALLPLLLVPDLSYEARRAVSAIGAAAVPDLKRLLDGERGRRAQELAARTLAQIASPRAVGALMAVVKSRDPRLRDLGFRSLARARVETGRPVLPRSAVHKLFLRELGAYRGFLEPALSLEGNGAPEVRLLADSFLESAGSALQRALGALACWYEPKPLAGAFDRLRSSEPGASAPALEYLGHVLPRTIFRHVSRVFEAQTSPIPARAETDSLTEAIRIAWRSEDGWLRACAVRASRQAPSFDRGLFATGDGDDPLVQAELEALSTKGAAC
jgi:ATP/ADP translocase